MVAVKIDSELSIRPFRTMDGDELDEKAVIPESQNGIRLIIPIASASHVGGKGATRNPLGFVDDSEESIRGSDA